MANSAGWRFSRLGGVLAFWVAIGCVVVLPAARAMDQVTLRRDGKTLEATGRVLLTAEDGGVALLARDGVIWLIPPEEQVDRKSDARPFTPFTREQLTKRMLAQLPAGFRAHQTKHYLIFYGTSPAYAEWCGLLFERLYMAFTNFWTRKKFELREPEFPLLAVVFPDRQSYAGFSRSELGEAGESIIGYFSLTSNRMTMFDLTGGESPGRGATPAAINQSLAGAMQTVATIVHEATHQIAFNCGLHARLSDCPRWFSEGIAVYFETPDLRSAEGWRGIGNVNRPRLEQFQRYLDARPADSLETLIRDDRRFTDPKEALNAYAETWALTYFLLRQHQKEYIQYLRALSAKKPLIQDGAERRINEFRRAFGELKRLDAEFLRYLGRVR